MCLLSLRENRNIITLPLFHFHQLSDSRSRFLFDSSMNWRWRRVAAEQTMIYLYILFTALAYLLAIGNRTEPTPPSSSSYRFLLSHHYSSFFFQLIYLLVSRFFYLFSTSTARSLKRICVIVRVDDIYIEEKTNETQWWAFHSHQHSTRFFRWLLAATMTRQVTTGHYQINALIPLSLPRLCINIRSQIEDR